MQLNCLRESHYFQKRNLRILSDVNSMQNDFIVVLFDLFDLNELESLASIDLEFMIYSSLSATYKIYSIN